MLVLTVIRNLALVAGIALTFGGLLGLMPAAFAWRRWSKGAALAAAGAQTGIGVIGVYRKQSGPSAVLVPLAAVLLLVAWSFAPSAKLFAFATPALELTILVALTVRALTPGRADRRPFEERFQDLLDRWLPNRANALVARIGALDLGGFAYVAGGWKRPPPPGIAYHRNNATLALVAVLAFAAIPEFFVTELFLGGRPLLWHAVNATVHVYVVFWFLALYVSFRDRPHAFDGADLVIRRGVFDSIRVPLATIDRVRPAKLLTRGERRALPPDAAYLPVIDSPLLELRLTHPLNLRGPRRKARLVKAIYVAADDPPAAVADIERAIRAES